MSVQLIAGHGNLDQEDAGLVALVLKSVGRMDRMIGLLLEFTRARLGGGLSLELGPADLQELCASAIGELALFSAAPILCEFQGDMTGIWDGERLVQVLSNIVGNAVGFAAPGTPVLVKARGDGAEIVIEISNQGEAIPADLLPVIFLPFHRGRPTEKARTGHLGLGLYIAHEIMISHGGMLDARSCAGTTTFTMRLPRLPVVVDPVSAG
jgi:signal transduction histidine kinase